MKGERLWRPDYGDSAPDGECATDVWDAKCYQRHAVARLYQEARDKYRKYADGRRFHLVLYDRSRRGLGDLVVLHADDFTDLLKKAGEL